MLHKMYKTFFKALKNAFKIEFSLFPDTCVKKENRRFTNNAVSTAKKQKKPIFQTIRNKNTKLSQIQRPHDASFHSTDLKHDNIFT